MIDGWRDPSEGITLPDVTLTGDEFLHMLAIQGETLLGNPRAHFHSRAVLGFPSPDCACCCSVMEKAKRFEGECKRIGATA